MIFYNKKFYVLCISLGKTNLQNAWTAFKFILQNLNKTNKSEKENHSSGLFLYDHDNKLSFPRIKNKCL